MDLTSYADFNTELDPTLLQEVENRLRMVLKQRWPQLDTSPSSVFGNLFITPAARVVAMIEQATNCILSDLNLENALNGVVCDCDFIVTFLKGLGVTALTDVNTTGMVRIHFTQNKEYTFDQGELILFDDTYVFSFISGNTPSITVKASTDDSTTADKVNNTYKLSIESATPDGEGKYKPDSWYVDLPVYGPASASLTAGSLGKIDEDFGKPIEGNKLTENYISSVELLHDINPLQLPTTLEELITLVRTITPAASLTTRANSISYMAHRFPLLKGVSMVLNSDKEMQRTTTEELSTKAPVVDLYVKGPHTLECTEYFIFDSGVSASTKPLTLQHIPLIVKSITEKQIVNTEPVETLYEEDNIKANELRTEQTKVSMLFDNDNFTTKVGSSTSGTSVSPSNVIYIKDDLGNVYAITLNGGTGSEHLTITQIPDASGTEEPIVTSMSNYDTGSEYTIEGTQETAIRFTKVLTGLDKFNTDGITYTLNISEDYTNNRAIAVTYLYDPIAEAVVKHINGPSCKPAFNIVVRPFITGQVKNLTVTYRKTAGRFFDRQKAIEDIYNFISSLTYPTIYDDAYIGDILMSCGASGVDKITADVRFQISGACGGYTPNTIYQDATSLSLEELESEPGDMSSYYGLGVRNVNYIIPNRDNIVLIERSTAHI